jgi:hypothetical protein
MSFLDKFRKSEKTVPLTLSSEQGYKSFGETKPFEEREEFSHLTPTRPEEKRFSYPYSAASAKQEENRYIQEKEIFEKILGKLELISAQNETMIEILREISMSIRYKVVEKRY